MTRFLLGTLTGSAATLALLYSVAYAAGLPTLFTVHLVAHDAAGRTLHATARGNSLAYDGAGPVLTVDFSTDDLWCNGMER
jgi:hypothetical protein